MELIDEGCFRLLKAHQSVAMQNEIVHHSGLIAAPYTPFDSRGSLNLDVIPAYADYLLRSGVSGVFVCGSTGEGASLSLDECKAVVAAWVSASAGRLPVFVNLAQSALSQAQELAAFAARSGAAAVATLAPYYYRPASHAELAAWCAALAGSCPELPFYYYHIPSMTGVRLPVAPLLPLLAKQVPNFAGVKFTDEDLDDYQACLAFDGGCFDVLFGRDELLLEGTARGALGAVGSTYNYAAPLYTGLLEALQKGDHAQARRRQDLAIEMIRLCCGAGVTHLAVTKALMPLLTGVDCGPVRLPLTVPAPERIAALARELEALDLFASQAGRQSVD